MDPMLIVSMSCLFGAGLVVIAAGILILERSERRRKMERLSLIVPSLGDEGMSDEEREEGRRRILEARIKALSEQKRFKKSRVGYVHSLLVRAGLDISISQFWIGAIIFAYAVTLPYAMLLDTKGKPSLAEGGIPIIFGVCLLVVPTQWLKMRAAARQGKFTKFFPDAMDTIIRGLESGLPFMDSMRVIATELPAPVSTEFGIIVDETNAGIPIGEALDRAYVRMPTSELKFFSTIIAIHAQSGGNLATVLGNISSVLRGRAQLREKAKALSGEAKFSAIIVGALPFLVSTFLLLFNPDYLRPLWATQMGNLILGLAIFMMILGIFVMNRMGKLDM